MHIFVKTSSETVSLQVNEKGSVSDIKAQLQSKIGVAPDEHYLTYGAKTMSDDMPLSAFDLQDDSTIHQVMNLVGGHCMVPCGIFDDPKLVAEVKEQCATIRKALKSMNELHGKGDLQSLNQITRWIMTKEEHCAKIITSMSEYCLCQRVKPHGAPKSPFKTEKDYVEALMSHHKVMTAAMKAKQSSDEAAAGALEHVVEEWSRMYLPK